MRVIKNKKAIETHELDRFRPLVCVIPYSYGLLVYIGYHIILHEFGGGPCPPYIVRGQGYKSVRSKR